MPEYEYKKAKKILLKNHSEYSEHWVQNIVCEDPSILGLGDLDFKQRERRQIKGRLDLLLQDSDANRRYEVELQLGSSDERHIIRTIEYWDLERRRHPRYEHCAVLVAEDITSRFLNVIGLFNGAIPFVAIQMQALVIDQAITLSFSTVVNELSLSFVGEDEETDVTPTDRNYWISRASKLTVELADKLLELAKQVCEDDSLELKYTKHYIGVMKDGRPFNFLIFKPRKNHIILGVKLPRDEVTDELIDSVDITTLEYNRFWGYMLTLSKEEVENSARDTEYGDCLFQLFADAYSQRS